MTRVWKAGFASAAVTGVLLFFWFQVEHWVIWRSAYTDLPGQDTHRLVYGVQPYVVGLVALVAGRVSGLLCRSTRWIAALLGVLPLVLLVAASARGFSFWYIVGPLLALIGAYAPTWIARRHVERDSGGPPRRAGPGLASSDL
jgi:hypothetical protein